MLRRNVSAPVSLELTDTIARFLSEYDGSAVRTKETYAYHLGVFVEWASANGVATIDAISPDHLREYITAQVAHRYTRPRSTIVRSLSNDTLQRRQMCVSIFLRWCVRQGFLDISPADRVKRIKGHSPARHAFTPQEARKLVLEAGKADGWLAYRDRAIVLFLLGTGARSMEILSLTPRHFTWRSPDGTDGKKGDQDLVLLNGKGAKDRRVRVGARTAEAIRSYLKHSRTRREGPDAPLFVTYRRETMVYGAFAAMLHNLGEYAQVPNVHPHRFRHTFAVEFYKANRDIMALKTTLGHSRVQTTERYLASLGVEYGSEAKFITPDTLLG